MEKRLLIVLGGPGDVIGGHKISAATLAKYLLARGNPVGMLVAPGVIEKTGVEVGDLKVHLAGYPSGKLAYFSKSFPSRTRAIYRLLRDHKYDAIIAMDWHSASHALPSAIRYGLPLVQIRAGGPVPLMPPYRLPGIIIFSDELKDGLHKVHRIPLADMFVASGRVDFEYYRSVPSGSSQPDSLGFKPGSTRVLAISRLTKGKFPAMRHLLNELQGFNEGTPLHLVVIGDGEMRLELEQIAASIVALSNGSISIDFLGALRAGPSHLRQADLVVGQGRTVVEAIAAGVPAAVCGSDGYIGLLTPGNFHELAKTNLTGRQIEAKSSLSADLHVLDDFKSSELCELRELAFERYDASKTPAAVDRALGRIESSYKNTTALQLAYAKALLLDFSNWVLHWLGVVFRFA